MSRALAAAAASSFSLLLRLPAAFAAAVMELVRSIMTVPRCVVVATAVAFVVVAFVVVVRVLALEYAPL